MTGPAGRLPRQLQEVDLLAVQRDDRALDGLSLRDPLPAADRVDSALALLEALTLEVDAGLDRLLARPLAAAEEPNAASRADGRRHGARLLAAAMVATGVLSVSGVAAAVTGDALAPYRRVVSAVSGSDSASAERARGRADTARLRQEVGALSGSLGSGHLAHAQLAIARLQLRILELPESKRPDALRRLARIEAQLAMVAARQDARAAHARGLGVGLATAPGQTSKPDSRGSTGAASSGGGKGSSAGTSRRHGRSSKGRQGHGSGKPATKSEKKSGDRTTGDDGATHGGSTSGSGKSGTSASRTSAKN